MPKDSRGLLRIQGWGGLLVDEARVLLGTIEHCYDSLYAYEALMDALTEGLPPPRFLFPFPWGVETLWLHRGISSHEFVSPRYQLVLKGTQLRSPGFWEFLGKLNPLEVIRLYLNDRHERRKDKEYRESAERERLRLENDLKRTELYKKQVRLLKDMGVTEAELAYLRNRFLFEPLQELGNVQDRGLITSAEFVANFVDKEREPTDDSD